MWTSATRRTIRREQRGRLTRTGCLATPSKVKERAGFRRALRQPRRSRRAPMRVRRVVRARQTKRAPPIQHRDRHEADNGRSGATDQRGPCRRVHRKGNAATSPWCMWPREPRHRHRRRAPRQRAPRDRSQTATCPARTRQRRGPTTATTSRREHPPQQADSRAWPRGRQRSGEPDPCVPASQRPHRPRDRSRHRATRSPSSTACGATRPWR